MPVERIPVTDRESWLRLRMQDLTASDIPAVAGIDPRRTIQITEPGLYRMPDAAYRADPCPEPSLTQSNASTLLERSPRHAWHRHPVLNPNGDGDEPNRKMDLGTVAHKLLLGYGREIVVIEAQAYTSKAAKEARDAAREAGKVPVLEGDYAIAADMVDAARRQLSEFEGCETLFAPTHGSSEVVIAWRDEAGPWCRGMLDWLSHDSLTHADYKTTGIVVRPDLIARHFYASTWHLQASFYDRGLGHIDPAGAGRRRAVFVAQETEAPYAISVVEADGTGYVLGHKMAAAAIGVWQRCLSTGNWPSYPRRVMRVSPPPYLEAAWISRELEDPLLVAAAMAALPAATGTTMITEFS